MTDFDHYRFSADVHLGRLAKWLRLLGFDVWYTNDATPATLGATALAGNRILLSKWAGFSQQPSLRFIRIESSDSTGQLRQVITQLHLQDKLQPFSRCLVCNGPLQAVPKAAVEDRVLPATQAAFHRFWQCTACKRPYWEGSHYERMQRLVEQVKDY